MNPVKTIGLSVVALLVVVIALVSPSHVFAQARQNNPARQQLIPTQDEFESIIEQNTSGESPQWTMESYDTASIFSKIGAINYGVIGSSDGSGAATGMVPQLGNAMSYMISNPPASGELWLADAFHNSPFLAETAYAQGVGFRSLTPILPIWKTFRDLAYICFIFVFAGIGFAIMFRKKLGGQTVATISSAIPRLVVTLLLITFSYAIAGFLIDLMYIVIYFISSVFTNLIDKPAAELVGIALNNNILHNGFNLIFQGQNILDGDPTTNSVAGAAAQSIGQIVQGFFGGTGVSAAIGDILGTAANVVGFLIIAMAIMFAVVKTFFELLKSYVTFVIMVIFSPFQLLFGAFKDNGDFVQWLRNLTATLAPFPVVITMIFLAMTLGGFGKEGIGFRGGDVSGGFQPPQLRLPFVSDAEGGMAAIQGLIVIGLLMLIPESVEMSKKWLKATSPMDDLLPKITKNLEKGWKGGQLVDGIGPTFAGAKGMPGKVAKGFGRAGQFAFDTGAGAVVGGLAGRRVGGQRGAMLGTIVGGLAGGPSKLPSTLAAKTIKSVGRQAGDITATLGSEYLQDFIHNKTSGRQQASDTEALRSVDNRARGRGTAQPAATTNPQPPRQPRQTTQQPPNRPPGSGGIQG